MSNLSQKLDQTSSLIDSSVNIEEAADRKKRLNNLILFNLPESAADLPEDQMKEDCLKLIFLNLIGCLKLIGINIQQNYA